MSVTTDLRDSLSAFCETNEIRHRGQVSVALHLTRCAIEQGLPLDSSRIAPNGDGYVDGLSRPRIQSILASHGETRQLSSAGGRTNRGNGPTFRRYCHFLNDSTTVREADLPDIEEWWVDRAREYFVPAPLRLRMKRGQSIQSVFGDILEQARTRQKDQHGSTLAGSVLQHLVGAKIEIVLGNREPKLVHHGASVADASTARAGDFVIAQTSIHVTLTPGDAVIMKCVANIEAGLRPILIVPFMRVQDAHNRAGDMGVRAKLEIIPAEQFLASNIHEWAQFDSARTTTSLTELIEMYNKIIELAETDRSLLIEL